MIPWTIACQAPLSIKSSQVFITLFFGHPTQHVGSLFPSKGLNPCPLLWKLSLNHWTRKEVPSIHYFVVKLFSFLLGIHAVCLLCVCVKMCVPHPYPAQGITLAVQWVRLHGQKKKDPPKNNLKACPEFSCSPP